MKEQCPLRSHANKNYEEKSLEASRTITLHLMHHKSQSCGECKLPGLSVIGGYDPLDKERVFQHCDMR